MQKDRTEFGVSLSDLEQCYKIAARVVSAFGDAYLPTFKRLHEEIATRYKQVSLKQIALDIVNNSKGCHR